MSNRIVKRNRLKKKINYDRHVVVVHRSNKNILAQVLEPGTKKTLVTFTSCNEKGTKTKKSEIIGEKVSNYLKKNKIQSVFFDRNGYLYHGRVKALAESIRKNNINI